MASSYDSKFFDHHHEGSLRSARAIVPIVRELVPFSSVVDVGCGTGTWLSVFAESGTGDYLGVDGPWVDPAALAIPREKFRAVDLSSPPPLGRRFDLAVSVEVAEHLPAQRAGPFVGYLASLAPVVVFSAAIPGQGGTNHVNEQWPDYWADLFNAENYACIDALRHRVWSSGEVQWWYAQNIMIYCDRAALADRPRLAELALPKGAMPARLVHPSCFQLALDRRPGLRTIVRETPRAIRRAIKGALRGRR